MPDGRPEKGISAPICRTGTIGQEIQYWELGRGSMKPQHPVPKFLVCNVSVTILVLDFKWV